MRIRDYINRALFLVVLAAIISPAFVAFSQAPDDVPDDVLLEEEVPLAPEVADTHPEDLSQINFKPQGSQILVHHRGELQWIDFVNPKR